MPTLDDYKKILESLGANNFVVQDDESWSYSTNEEPAIVVRVYKDSSEKKHQALEHKKRICELLDNGTLPFTIEKIYSIHFADGKLYSRENRLFGVRLSQILDKDVGLSAKAYCSVAQALRDVPTVELLPIFKWADFIFSSINNALSSHFELLKINNASVSYKAALQLAALISKNLKSIEIFGLVHGMLTPANCLVDPTDTNKVIAVLNFSELTVIGDPRLESASQLFFAENLDPTLSKKMTLGIIASMVSYGENIHTVVNIYRIYWATILLEDPRYQSWAFNVLRNIQAILDADHIWQPFSEHKPLQNQWHRKKTLIPLPLGSSSLSSHRVTFRAGADGEDDLIETLSPSSTTVTRVQKSFLTSYSSTLSGDSITDSLGSIEEDENEEAEDWFKDDKLKNKSSSEKLGL